MEESLQVLDLSVTQNGETTATEMSQLQSPNIVLMEQDEPQYCITIEGQERNPESFITTSQTSKEAW